MRFRVRQQRTPIGLDLGAHSFKAVQLLQAGGAWEVIAAADVPRTQPGAEFTRTEMEDFVDVMHRQGFVGNSVNISLQPAQTIACAMELPARAPGLPMDEIARSEFCRVNKVEPDGIVMSYWDLPTPARAARCTSVLAVGCRTGDADSYLDLVESAGIEVRGLDASGSAVARACLKHASADGAVTAIVDLGWTAATLSIVKSGVVVYDRRVSEAGLSVLVQGAAEATGAAPMDVEYVLRQSGIAEARASGMDASETESECRARAMAHFGRTIHELTQAFGYAAHRYPDCDAPCLLLAGGGAGIPGLSEFFERALKLPVKLAGAAEVVQCPAALAATMSQSMLAATGLALFEQDLL
jgi:Tfp pilus assembly PilM family ATPase